MKLSIIIPSYKDPYLKKTINSLLTNSQLPIDQLEIIAVLDGYWSEDSISDDERVKIVHLGQNVGMREAINSGVRVARGEFIMRTDEHCLFPKGFDKTMTDRCRENWIMCAPQYFLDPINWNVMPDPPVLHQKLVIQGGVKFAGRRWPERDEEMKDEKISETMAMQGSCWVMPKKWWENVIGELQTEGYGPLIQDSHEMVFKTWKAGGKLMLNKHAWYAHKHRKFPRTHNNGTKQTPANCDAGYKYAIDVWGEYYEKEIIPKWNLR